MYIMYLTRRPEWNVGKFEVFEQNGPGARRFENTDLPVFFVEVLDYSRSKHLQHEVVLVKLDALSIVRANAEELVIACSRSGIQDACKLLHSKLQAIPFESVGVFATNLAAYSPHIGRFTHDEERQLLELIHPPWSRRRALLLPYHQWKQDNPQETGIPVHLLAEIASFL